MVWALDETERPVFFDDQHLVIAGQPKCGRTTACAAVMAEIGRVYAPGAESAAAGQPGRPAAQVWLIDPRRQLPMCWGVVCAAVRVDAAGGQGSE